MAIEAGNEIDEEAIDEEALRAERRKRRAKRKKNRMKIAENAQIEEQINADEENILDDQVRRKCFTNYGPKFALLWSMEHDRGIINFLELISILKNKGFRLIDDHGYWRRFRFTKGKHSRWHTLENNTPRLPFSDLEGCHPSVYLGFMEDIAVWIGKEETAKAFSINIVAVGTEVRCWEDGIFPCSWKNENWILWYKNMTLDLVTINNSMQYGWGREYLSDFLGDIQNKVDKRETAIREMTMIMTYDEGVCEDWKNCRLVCLWDVVNASVISNNLQLKKVMESIGFQQEMVTHNLGYYTIQLESGEKIEIFPDPPVEYFPWLYGDEATQGYSFPSYSKRRRTNSTEGLPWLPFPYMVGCHPLVYFFFYQNLERYIGKEKLKKTFDLRGIPVGLLPDIYLDDLAYYKHTLWKKDLGYKYRRTFLIKDVLKELESLKLYMLGFGVDGGDIKEYCADAAEDLKKDEADVDREAKKARKNKRTRDAKKQILT